MGTLQALKISAKAISLPLVSNDYSSTMLNIIWISLLVLTFFIISKDSRCCKILRSMVGKETLLAFK